MTHLFRPADPVVAPTPPVGTWQQAQRAGRAARSLARSVQRLDRHQIRRGLCIVLLLAGLVVQLVLYVLVAELVDLSVSLMEVWVELAAKHTRILQ